MTNDILYKAGKIIGESYADVFMSEGRIDSNGKTHNEIIKEALNIILSLKSELTDDDFVFILDYRDNLLEKVNLFKEKKECQSAIIFLALWYEHWLNSVIDSRCLRKRINKTDATKIIRSVNLDAKQSWLLKLLDLPDIDSKAKKAFLHIIEVRNSFLHYKYNHLCTREENEKYVEVLENACSYIKILQEYEIIYVYSGFTKQS